MALSTSPRKTIPLATGDGPRPRSRSSAAATASVTKRVFFCGVVIEGSENGKRLPEEIQELVLSFGDSLAYNSSSNMLSPISESPLCDARQRSMTDTSALASVINELVTSERSYVKRLQILKTDYADPLRSFARNRDTAIIPLYEAKTLFGNIDNLLPVNEAFLTDLEKMLAPNGARAAGGVGDVALRHFKDLRGFEQYKQYYTKREEAQSIFERELSKRNSRFGSFIDHIKYQSTDARNRVGLRELLMEPVQRIPRYTLLFRTMLKHMAPDDPQRVKLLEADEIASKIALAEADEETKRAAIFYCLSAAIDGFPPELFSNSRRFIDCIDVEDVLFDAPIQSGSSSTGASATTLHCTLFLFDDKILIAKRPGNGEKSGRTLTGLDDLDRVTKAGGKPSGKKRSGMTYKGVVDVTDVVVTDVEGADFHVYFENPPLDQTDRWSGRPFRSLSVVHPPLPINLDPTQTENDKQRFLENLWRIQANYRARAGQSVVLCAKEQEVESKTGKITYARTYYNVYQRTAFLQEQKKTKIVVHVDPIGSADPIPFGIGGPPFARIRLQPMAGGLCRFSLSSNDPNDEGEEDIVQTERVPSRIVQTIHQFGFFEFRTGRDSRPSTPTARSRVAIFGLDAISRNLFSSRPGSAMGDFFGGSINNHRRTKSTTSRSSMYTQTTSTGDSLLKFSQRSSSSATAATTIYSADENLSVLGSSRSSRPRRKPAVSPGGNLESDKDSPLPTLSRQSSTTCSRTPSREMTPEISDTDEEEILADNVKDLDTSDWDLAMKLELARQNSKNQHGIDLLQHSPVEEIIYEEEPPFSIRPSSRSSRQSRLTRPTTPQSGLESPNTPTSISSPCRSRSVSRHSAERRPVGPRCPSPLPTAGSPRKATVHLPSFDDEFAEDSDASQASTSSRMEVTRIPRSKRYPFPSSIDATPKPSAAGTPSVHSTIEPLSIKKKTSIRSGNSVLGSPTPARRAYVRNSPLSRPSNRIISPRRVSPQIRRGKLFTPTLLIDNDSTEQLVKCCESTHGDIMKQIRSEVEELRLVQISDDPQSRSCSPDKGLRSSQLHPPPLTKAAQERMEEMRQLIGKRQTDVAPRHRPRSVFESMPVKVSQAPVVDKSQMDKIVQSVDDLISEADSDLARALSTQEKLQNSIRRLGAGFREKSIELERTKLDLQNSRRQCELMKSLLADATAEKEIMYEAFNEELDAMYSDANLPDDEAWIAMSKDLRETKEARNMLSRENSQLRRQLAEAESERDEWGKLLRGHGLIP
ncbi:hypothetical protein AMATHDRAFT_75013 [Amanita thiersii Skay4041]|uniref:DH domain-containing protein n=1 Tax=Amanita thiersii Skay4041 TaxID=703135 RepID=A0A2A9NU98_9AGAR|nr:hypothetical protein AMATHDRAFT_75013 [Amanita thiersii Skay4041]